MAKSETVMLAHPYNERRDTIAGWFASTKLDGLRCIWDGGVTRGRDVKEISWANSEKDRQKRICTGLWTRYLKPIIAPDWIVDMLPEGVCLDGEIWSPHGWQHCSSVVKRLDLTGDWSSVEYHIFDVPHLFFETRWVAGKRLVFDDIEVGEARTFEANYNWIMNNLQENSFLKILRQEQLPFNGPGSRDRVGEMLDSVVMGGGEGVMVRSPWSIWTPERSRNILKIKGVNDDEGTVVGYVGGKGKLSGLFGALVLDYKGRRLELSGFTDDERRMMCNGVEAECGEGELGDEWEGVHFKRGDVVTFRYRELSDGLIPKEARYWRKRVD